MWTRCFPAMIKARELIREGAIGTPVSVQGDFGWSTEDCGPNDRIWFPQSGGMTLDIGMYMAQLGQVAFEDAELQNVQAMGTLKNGIDHTVLVNCRYSFQNDGEQFGFLQFLITGQANTEERVVIQGTKGRIVIDSPAHVPETIHLIEDKGRGSSSKTEFKFPLPDYSYTTWNYPGSIGFTHQIKAVGDALLSGLKECMYYTLDDSLQVALILEQVRQQIVTGDEQRKKSRLPNKAESSSGKSAGSAMPKLVRC